MSENIIKILGLNNYGKTTENTTFIVSFFIFTLTTFTLTFNDG